MANEKTFTEVIAFWFHHGGRLENFITGDGHLVKGINQKILDSGWRLVNLETLEQIIEHHQRFLHRQDGWMIATDPKSVNIVPNDKNPKTGDIMVPGVHSSNEKGLVYYTKPDAGIIIRCGFIYDHSEIHVLAVK